MYRDVKKKFKLTDKNITSNDISIKKLLLKENKKKPKNPIKNNILVVIKVITVWKSIFYTLMFKSQSSILEETEKNLISCINSIKTSVVDFFFSS